MLSATQDKTLIRNYLIALGTVMFLSLGLSDLYHQPSKDVQQTRLNHYGHFITAGLVSHTQKSLYR
jgi:hypothetical protein